VLAVERRRRIMEPLGQRPVVSMRDLVELVGASEITVRRDLRAMAADGLLVRTHGGAMLRAEAYEPTYSEKESVADAEKAAIADRAAELVQTGESIVLGPGTTTLALARRLAAMDELTVATNSLLVAQALVNAPGVEVLVMGGALRRSIHALVGPATEAAFREIRASRAFLSGNGLTAERGLTTPNPMVAAVDRAIAATARQLVVLADYTKIGADSMFQTVPCEAIGVLVTDGRAEPAELAQIRARGVDVLGPAHL
jgi:DeoR/GlpR family transcriptional regulator of sugar metabolism